MEIEFDPAKSERNAQERGLPFTLAALFVWPTAKLVPAQPNRAGEDRLVALGRIEGIAEVHALVFTMRGPKLRVISLRRAKPKEVRTYEKA